MVSLIKKKYMTHPKKIFSKNLKLATWTCLPNMVSLAQGEKIYDLHHMPAKYGEPSSGEKKYMTYILTYGLTSLLPTHFNG